MTEKRIVCGLYGFFVKGFGVLVFLNGFGTTMFSYYDEDLSQNSFFKEIKQNHEDILKKSAEENWIICVPKSGSLISDNNLINVVLDHVLVKDIESNFTTLSKKEVCLENHHLKIEQNSIYSDIVKVLFEETHYLEETAKYTVWCIEKPLFLLPNHCDIPNNNVTLNTIQDCIDFLYAETFGHNVLENIQKLCLDFWNAYEDSFEMESLQCQKDLTGNLYSQCLQLFFKSDIIREKCDKSEQFLQLFKVSIETYMQYCLGKRLIYSVNTVQHFNDCILNKIIRNSSDISLNDLNISDNFGDSILNGNYELYRINNFVTALDKLNCLSRTFIIFNKNSSHNDQKMYVTSDDFLQILVYLILHSNIPNWAANLTYLKEFNFATLENPDQNSFLVTSLEAAIEFIKSSQFLDITHNTLNKNDKQNSTLFNSLYNKLKSERNKSVLTEPLDNNTSEFYKKIELCHPLCSCVKCENLIVQPSSQRNFRIVNEFNQNFFIMACIEDNVNLLEYLFSLDFDINFKDNFGKTALHYAAEKGFQDILLLLVNSKANVNVLDNDRNTPLHLASDRGQEHCVKALIYSSYFVEVNLQNIFGETPLFLATKWGYLDIIKILLENGASVCVKNNQNLSVYKLSPNFYITKLFKEFGSRKSNIILEESIREISISSSHSIPNISEENCNNIVHIFKEQGLLYGNKPKSSLELKQIDLLIKTVENNDLPLTCFYLGYNSSSVKTERLTKKCHPLCTCRHCGKNDDSKTADLFEQTSPENITKGYKFNVNTYNNDGFTPLHIAAKFGRTEILRILLDCGAYLNVRTLDTLYTSLHLSVMFQRVQTVKELLKCGDCNVDAQDYKGNTPLYYACIRNNNLKTVEILLQNRADCQKRNDEQKSILQVCEEKNLFRVCRMLRESMGYSSPKINDILFETTSSNARFADIDSDFEIL